jgi:hypothetical protein
MVSVGKNVILTLRDQIAIKQVMEDFANVLTARIEGEFVFLQNVYASEFAGFTEGPGRTPKSKEVSLGRCRVEIKQGLTDAFLDSIGVKRSKKKYLNSTISIVIELAAFDKKRLFGSPKRHYDIFVKYKYSIEELERALPDSSGMHHRISLNAITSKILDNKIGDAVMRDLTELQLLRD